MTISGSRLDLELIQLCSADNARLNEQLDRRMQVTMSPTLPSPGSEIRTNSSRFRKKREQVALAFASWWLGDLGWLIRQELLETSSFTEVRLCCNYKATAMEVILSSMSNSDFFGNLVPLVKRILHLLRVNSLKPKRAKRTQRRRGYRDHGTLRPSHKPSASLWNLNKEQKELERQRQEDEDTYQFLRGLLGEI
jgi:hypothetical protein